MSLSHVRSFLIATTIGLVPLCGNTAEATNSTPQESFQTNCVDSWMKRMEDIKDKIGYRNFGEKYCECASRHPLDTQEAVNKTMQLCMSQTLLQDTMDSLENEVGLDKATNEDIDEYCIDKFTLVFPKMDDKDKQASSNYCSCAKPELMKLVKISDNLTDKQYSDQINAIAAQCSSGVSEGTSATAASSDTQSTTNGEDSSANNNKSSD
ncbi:hypothetical protein [Legionella cardiaca]|uniref:Uncharacterized protein n=1 Tax=Legionella cardiaca TaxID=1071983 RepID=A0ABY8AY71_9GAMM|nr:hypothetical protein [Legionella cardiaca]WED44062.1 hypothetical protein PXX05_04550 [Legionella cardiaca]